MSEKRLAAAVAWSSEPKNNQTRSSGSDTPQGSLGVVVGHGQPSVVEEPAQGGLLPDGVAERGGDQTSGALDACVLLLDPGEEVVDERPRDELPSCVSLRGSQRLVLVLELEQFA